MKWKDLSLKERKQIYDSVRVNNPDATYFDIKEQFDSIPAYEGGKAGYTPEERAWVARRTVELGMEGKPAPQDSLYTIVDRAKVQNKPKKYDPTDSAIEQGKQVLSGLNKTVGTALTGASLATMGLWNAARLLNVGTGSSWRLWAAKNALTGANAGLAADVGNFIEDPSITNAVQVGLSKVGSKDLTTTSNKIVNTMASGFDFDDLTKVPTYEDGGKKVMPPKELGLTPGTPEYYKRQQQISGKASTVQPEAYITPAGYVKDAINFVEDLSNGDYTGAAVDAALNIIPWGVGKTLKKFKSKVGRLIEGTDEYATSSYAEPFTPTITKPIKAKRTPSGERNYNPAKPPKDIEAQAAVLQDTWYGKANMKNIQDGFTSSNVDDYSIVLDPSTYIPGTANHELGHMADGIAGSIKYEAEPGVDYITNPYLRYLADPDNTYTTKELRDAGFHSAARNKRYLLNPTESKSHMLTLKRALKDSNKISKWSDPVDENMILDYFRSGRANGAVRNQYDLYIDKQRYIDRLNRLVPMEWLLPTIGLGGAEFLREKQNNKSN